MFKNYAHNVIRLRKGKGNKKIPVYWIIVILNKKKANSQGMIERLGFFSFGKNRMSSINFKRMSFYLNRGSISNLSVKKFIYLHAQVVL